MQLDPAAAVLSPFPRPRRIVEHSPHAFSEALRAAADEKISGLPGNNDLRQASHVRGQHRLAGGVSLRDDHSKGLVPFAWNNDEARPGEQLALAVALDESFQR